MSTVTESTKPAFEAFYDAAMAIWDAVTEGKGIDIKVHLKSDERLAQVTTERDAARKRVTELLECLRACQCENCPHRQGEEQMSQAPVFVPGSSTDIEAVPVDLGHALEGPRK